MKKDGKTTQGVKNNWNNIVFKKNNNMGYNILGIKEQYCLRQIKLFLIFGRS